MRINRKGNKGSNGREMRVKNMRIRVIGKHTLDGSQLLTLGSESVMED